MLVVGLTGDSAVAKEDVVETDDGFAVGCCGVRGGMRGLHYPRSWDR